MRAVERIIVSATGNPSFLLLASPSSGAVLFARLFGMLAGLQLLPKDCGVRSIFPPSGSDMSRLSKQSRGLCSEFCLRPASLGLQLFCTEGAGRAAPRPLGRSPPFVAAGLVLQLSGGLRDDLPTPPVVAGARFKTSPLLLGLGFSKEGELEGEKKGT